MVEVWIVGQFIAETSSGSVWDFQGVFATKEEAIDACINNKYFIAPAVIGQRLKDETHIWPGAEYPDGA